MVANLPRQQVWSEKNYVSKEYNLDMEKTLFS